VNVSFSKQEQGKPSVQIETTSIDEIESMLSKEDNSRYWTEDEIEEVFSSSENKVIRDLLALAKVHSDNNKIHSTGKKLNPALVVRFVSTVT
jgi:hypothetical protein